MNLRPEKIKLGIIGCGNISAAYFKTLKRFNILHVFACADTDASKAEAKAAEFNVPECCTPEEIFRDPGIRIIVNLTTPEAHYEVAMAAIEAGKCVYNEKPLTINLEDGKRLLEAAEAKGLLLGCAPDTFLGAGIQTSRKLIDDGWIGEPVAAAAFMMSRGHEHWHPAPEFYYKPGGGPMFDMGPYYLTALINLIGTVERVTGSTKISFHERTITSKPRFGEKIKVEVPTHVAGVMDFSNGAAGTIITSFDVWGNNLSGIEIYGTEGSLRVADPNSFGGPVHIFRAGESQWREMPLAYGYAGQSRGIGVADMAYALRSGRNHRASGGLAYHVLEVMHSFHDACRENRHIKLAPVCPKPAPLPMGLTEGVLDE